jgi:methionine-rich copper-binding protein CopC
MSSRTGRRSRRHTFAAWAGTLVASAFVVLSALPAQAHASLISSSPADGDVVASVPIEVTFTFDDSLGSPAYVTVAGPDGSNIADGAAVVDGATVTQAVRLFPQSGKYTASYRVVSDDGHPVTGTIHFTVDPVHGTTAPSSATSGGSTCGPEGCGDETAFWQRESTWIVVAVAGFALALLLVFVVGMRSGSTSPEAGGSG